MLTCLFERFVAARHKPNVKDETASKVKMLQAEWDGFQNFRTNRRRFLTDLSSTSTRSVEEDEDRRERRERSGRGRGEGGL